MNACGKPMHAKSTPYGSPDDVRLELAGINAEIVDAELDYRKAKNKLFALKERAEGQIRILVHITET